MVRCVFDSKEKALNFLAENDDCEYMNAFLNFHIVTVKNSRQELGLNSVNNGLLYINNARSPIYSVTRIISSYSDLAGIDQVVRAGYSHLIIDYFGFPFVINRDRPIL